MTVLQLDLCRGGRPRPPALLTFGHEVTVTGPVRSTGAWGHEARKRNNNGRTPPRGGSGTIETVKLLY